MEGKLRNNRVRWYVHISRMNKEIILKNVLNMKSNGKCARGTSNSRWEEQNMLLKGVTRKEHRT
jgi:hypothetical protein